MEILSVLEPHLMLVFWQVLVFLIVITGIVAIIDVGFNKFENNQQLLWLLICLFVPLGGVLYFLIGRKQRIRVS